MPLSLSLKGASDGERYDFASLPCIEQSNGPVSLSPSQSWPDCIINTSGYNFRKGQAWLARYSVGNVVEGIPIRVSVGDKTKAEFENNYTLIRCPASIFPGNTW